MGPCARAASLPLIAGLALASCGTKTPSLPTDPIERAASCGVIAAATERGAAGAKGSLSADAQMRIFHYPLLAGAQAASFDHARADAVFKRMPDLFDQTIKGEWQTHQPECAAAYPATAIDAPTLPTAPLDSVAQCYALANFMRKALGGLGGSFEQAGSRYGIFATKLDPRLSTALTRAGIRSDEARKAHADAALSAAAKLGQPQAVLAACEKKYE
jgi:hypothetical protein